MAGSDLKDAHSTEEALQAKIQKLEHFINMSHRSAADFDATRAAELVDALQKASAKVEENAAQHERNAKQALREARRHALGQVRSFEEKARAAVKTWKFHGIQAVKAQKGADLPEHLYESHEDRMRDAVGDAEDKAEGVVEKLEDRIHEHYGKLEDQLGDASFNARGKVLRHKAERAEERLRELARTLGASAALKEAQAASRFAAEEKSWRASHAPQLLVATRQSANASVKSSSEDSEVMAAQAMEQQAANHFKNSLSSLRELSAEDIISKASNWRTLQDLAAASRPSGSDSWEEALESNTKKLEQFNNESRKSAADFDASHAAKLAEAVHRAAGHVEHDADEQRHNMKAAMKAARKNARQHVKTLEAEARAAAKSWKFHGRRAVKAQRSARVPEHVYERHEDRMRDAVGDAEDRAENAAERLEEKVTHHFERLEDQLGDASFNARGKVLRHKAERAEERLRELARTLGASAALNEAQAASRFAAEEKSWRASHAPQLLVATRQSANASVKSSSEDSEVMAAQAMEQQAANHFKNSLSSLRELSAEDIISKASNWRTLQDLAAASRPSGSDSWEEALESNTKKLEQFNNESRKSAADFDASHAAKLAEAVHRAAGHVEHDADEQRHNMKAAMKAARKNARQHVKTLEAEARAAAKSWKFHGRRAVKAQRSARVPEHVYERHEDRMRDAVGDAEDRAENAAERLEEKVTHHFERLEDQLGDASFNARGKVLRHKAERAEERLRELARTLGASAALKEAQAASRFAAEEKSWRASHAPQQLLGGCQTVYLIFCSEAISQRCQVGKACAEMPGACNRAFHGVDHQSVSAIQQALKCDDSFLS